MKFLTKIHNPKVHPLSKKILDVTTKILSDNGITDTVTQAECTLDLFQLTIKNAREIQAVVAKEKDVDKLLELHITKYKTVLDKYGIAKEEQERIILEYLDAVGSLG